MELSQEEAVASYSSNSSSSYVGGDGFTDINSSNSSIVAVDAAVTRRKRTKRSRLPPPPIPVEAEEEYFSTTTEEDEDTAHCLILLAQGRAPALPREEKFVSRRFAEAAATAGGGKVGYYVYECKTCNKCFPSFQALGGHRASHKKPRLDTDVDAVAGTTALAVGPAASRFRVHECSICGLEFASGQALGGHMRRHRPIGAAAEASSASVAAAVGPAEEKEKDNKSNNNNNNANMLSLDLNLPAPAEDGGIGVAFGFSDRRPVVAMVDCHY